MPDDNPVTSPLWISIALAFLTSAVLVMSALLDRSGPIRLRHFAEEAGGRLGRLFDRPIQFEAFRYLLNGLGKVAPAALCGSLALWLHEHASSLPVAVGEATSIVAALVLGVELINRFFVARDPESALSRLTGFYRVAHFLLGPLVILMSLLLPRSLGEPPVDDGTDEDEEVSDEEIDAFIDVGKREGILEPEQEDLVRGVVDFGDTQVRSVMTPRIDIVCAAADASFEDLVQRFVESRRSRIPLVDESIDHVVGVLHLRDLVRGLQSNPRPRPLDLAKPALFVPLTKELDELLREMQSRHQQIAIVVDEYGGTAGLVTVEDLVEEIFGDIADEHERETEQPQTKDLGDGTWLLDGRMHLEELEDLFEVEIGEVPYETVGGLILSELGEVPQTGVVVETHGLRLTVEKVSDRRIQTIRAEKLRDEEEESADV